MPAPSVLIAGRPADTKNYENTLKGLGVSCFVSLDADRADAATHLLLPGGGDITPAFFGQTDHGSLHIDTALDILQLEILARFVAQKKPVLGICKGLQLINVHFGGDVTQHIDTAENHKWVGRDQFHYVFHCDLGRRDFFYQLYGNSSKVNSAHHQAINRTGGGLVPVCRAGDNVIEGLVHHTLPILAAQWHPERLPDGAGESLFSYFLSLP
ncbi:MAG: gamma-glutamyl-gamma-aminobutyrate hydrolase family protein [Lachnospiraceae bacterium]|nr:gamma-glutamyl-gamma-aminobutyrate hydrolase family protein [Lachnospiraceae bacterium]MDE6603116.1 gamma-glutamyl-gamma-aminobutyrate hydrolase family protein [Lachnospiraceae bacterium]